MITLKAIATITTAVTREKLSHNANEQIVLVGQTPYVLDNFQKAAVRQ
ncbi:hypothetical protein LWHH1689_0195 [Limosilactobacillus reuteri]|uniref:Uncharacterized protein n=1 Tax=Limosilactobacillus reuteri TaxID=1598 RepID=A0A2S1ENQ8_LIMRT|nr:hypothetical protein LWHH1689_0195 [Limosilactobacillus reuteri]